MLRQTKVSQFILITLYITLGVLAFGSVCYESPTVDEIEHIASGYYFLTTGLSPFNFAQPPLIKLLGAAPLLLLPLHAGLFFQAQGATPLGVLYGFNFFYKVGNDPQAIVLFSRAAIFSFNFVLLFLSSKVVASIYGRKIGIVFSLLLICSPTFFAHSRYVTMDVPLTLLLFLSILLACKYQVSPTLRHLFITSLAIVCSLEVKFSALILFPVLLVSSFIFTKLNFHRQYNSTSTSQLLVRVATITFLSIALYFLSYSPIATRGKMRPLTANQEVSLSTHAGQNVQFHGSKGGSALLLSGIKMQIRRVVHGGIEYGYLAGEMYKGGTVAFFPTLFLLKEQIIWLFVVFSGVILEILTSRLKRKYSSDLHSLISHTLAIFVLVYGMFCVFGNLNLGLRHLLPLYPPLILIAVLGHVHFATFSLRTFKLLRAGVLLCGIGVLLSYPHYISHFNLFGGGRAGYVWGIDSNFDWGQDTRRFVDWMNQKQIPHAYIDYFGRGNPHYYLKERVSAWTGSEGIPPANSIFVISVTRLQQARARRASYPEQFPFGSNYEWLEALTPIQIIGRSIFVYKVPDEGV